MSKLNLEPDKEYTLVSSTGRKDIAPIKRKGSFVMKILQRPNSGWKLKENDSSGSTKNTEKAGGKG